MDTPCIHPSTNAFRQRIFTKHLLCCLFVMAEHVTKRGRNREKNHEPGKGGTKEQGAELLRTTRALPWEGGDVEGGAFMIRLGVNNSNNKPNSHHPLRTYHVPGTELRMLPIEHCFSPNCPLRLPLLFTCHKQRVEVTCQRAPD